LEHDISFQLALELVVLGAQAGVFLLQSFQAFGVTRGALLTNLAHRWCIIIRQFFFKRRQDAALSQTVFSNLECSLDARVLVEGGLGESTFFGYLFP
jgi:hypothetical protein